MNSYTSEKIRNLSFIAIIAVFFIHTNCFGGKGSGSYLFQELLHTGSNFAVPLFFIISGYLFFYGKDNKEAIRKGMKKRVRTLAIPYVCWCALFILQIWLASMVKPLNQDYFSILENGEVLRFLKRMFIAPPYAFHLWYVRDLLALVAISPIVYLAQRKRPMLFLLIVAVLCGVLKLIPWLSWPLTWFSIGSYFAFTKKDLLELDNKWIGVVMLAGYIVITVILISNRMFTTADRWYSFPLILLGVIGIWNTYDIIGIHKYFKGYITDQTFFLYCAHVPFLSMISIMIRPHIPDNAVLQGFAYLLPAAITCIVLIVIARWWKKLNRKSTISSTIYRFLTGGR